MYPPRGALSGPSRQISGRSPRDLDVLLRDRAAPIRLEIPEANIEALARISCRQIAPRWRRQITPRLRLQIEIPPRSRQDRAELAPIKNAHARGVSVALTLEMASPRTMKGLVHGAREEKMVSVVRAARREMIARGGQASGRVAGGNERSASAPTRDAERGVKTRGVELVDGAVDGGDVALTSPAPSDAEALKNLRRIGEVTRRFGHTPPV